MNENGSTADSLTAWLIAWLGRELQVPEATIDIHENLLTYGLDSVNAMMLVGDMEDRLGLRLPPTLLWEQTTVAKLVAFVESLRSAETEQLAGGNSTFRQSSGGTQRPEIDSQVVPDLDSLSLAEAKQLLDRLDELTDNQVHSLLRRLSAEN